jgi:hypothetical protein
MRPLSSALVLALALSSCTSDSKEVKVIDRFKDGSRLKQITIDVNGTKHFDGIQDTELDIWCDYERMASGNHRCTPTDVTYSYERYAAPGCTEPIFAPWNDCAVRPYVAVRVASECGPARAIFEVSEETVEIEQYYTITPKGCQPVKRAGTYKRLVPVPEETFVQGTWKLETLNDQLAVEYFDGSDGSRYADRLHDRKQGFSCYPTTFGKDSTVRCYPSTSGALTDGWTSDMECRPEKIAEWNNLKQGGVCQPDAIIARASCDTDYTFFAPEERLTQAEFYKSAEGACYPMSPSVTQTYWRLGPTMDAGAFLTGESTVNGSGRGAWRVTAVAGHGWQPLQMDDPTIGFTSGYSYFAEDGSYRVIPNEPATVSKTYFRDSECKKGLIADSLDCPPTEPKFALESVGDRCDVYGRSAVWRVTGRHTGAVYGFDEEENCVELAATEVPQRLFLGEHIEPGRLLETPRIIPQ